MSNSALQIVQVINSLLQLTQQLGLSYRSLSARIAQAEVEGREFDLKDLRTEVQEAREALERLELTILETRPNA